MVARTPHADDNACTIGSPHPPVPSGCPGSNACGSGLMSSKVNSLTGETTGSSSDLSHTATSTDTGSRVNRTRIRSSGVRCTALATNSPATRCTSGAIPERPHSASRSPTKVRTNPGTVPEATQLRSSAPKGTASTPAPPTRSPLTTPPTRPSRGPPRGHHAPVFRRRRRQTPQTRHGIAGNACVTGLVLPHCGTSSPLERHDNTGNRGFTVRCGAERARGRLRRHGAPSRTAAARFGPARSHSCRRPARHAHRGQMGRPR